MSSNEPPTYPRPEGEDGPSSPGQEPAPPGGQPPPEQPPVPPSPPGYGPPPPGYQQPVGAYGGGGQQNQKALWSMILGIVGLVCCGLFTAIPAIILGHMGKKEIDAAGGAQSGRGMAQAGFIMGIIGTVLSVVGLIIYVAIFATAISSGEFSGTEF
jgi:Domain of unknown function (DUF4190)